MSYACQYCKAIAEEAAKAEKLRLKNLAALRKKLLKQLTKEELDALGVRL